MKNKSKSQIALFIMVFILLECIESVDRKEHPIENEFSHDTFLRTYSTSVASITASPATDLGSIKTMRDFIHRQ